MDKSIACPKTSVMVLDCSLVISPMESPAASLTVTMSSNMTSLRDILPSSSSGWYSQTGDYRQPWIQVSFPNPMYMVGLTLYACLGCPVSACWVSELYIHLDYGPVTTQDGYEHMYPGSHTCIITICMYVIWYSVYIICAHCYLNTNHS